MPGELTGAGKTEAALSYTPNFLKMFLLNRDVTNASFSLSDLLNLLLMKLL